MHVILLLVKNVSSGAIYIKVELGGNIYDTNFCNGGVTGNLQVQAIFVFQMAHNT